MTALLWIATVFLVLAGIVAALPAAPGAGEPSTHACVGRRAAGDNRRRRLPARSARG